MAQTFEQAIKDYLGRVTFQSIQLAFENEQLTAQLRDVTAQVPKPRKLKVGKESRDGG